MGKINSHLALVITAYCLLVISGIDNGAHAATLSLLRNPVTLSQISARNILLQAGTEREITLGQTTGTIDPMWAVRDINISPPGLIRTTFNRNINNLWQLQFVDREFFEEITVDVSYTLIDNDGMTGFLNSVFVPASRIAVTGTLRRLRERRRRNGSLRDLRGGASFAIDIRQAISNGPHSGTLVVEVNFM